MLLSVRSDLTTVELDGKAPTPIQPISRAEVQRTLLPLALWIAGQHCAKQAGPSVREERGLDLDHQLGSAMTCAVLSVPIRWCDLRQRCGCWSV
eukprot:SAG31_NODE_2247_length_6094_cov_6.426522_6_plen_94_part_00